MDSTTSSDTSIAAVYKAGLQDLLKQVIATVTFTKKDGTERVMKCTLMESVVIPHEKTTERTKQPKEDLLSVWDIESQGWRTITIPNIKTVEYVK